MATTIRDAIDALTVADTMAAGWAPGATVEQIDAAERAAAQWRRRRGARPPRLETTTPPVETRSA